MIHQCEFPLFARPQGFHLITSEILSKIPPLPETGLLHLFMKHTSAGLSLNENADPEVRTDLINIFDKIVPENQPFYEHTYEGEDDMPAHAKCSITGVSLTIPITKGKLNLGSWQGIYLCEFRKHGGSRRVVATIFG